MKITGKIIAVASVCLFGWSLTAWTAMPFSDDFECYTNQTPLINGLNGWYASDVTCIAQTNVSYTNYEGTKSAQIPIDVTLSNRFTGNAFTSVWVRFYSRAVLYNAKTNAATGIAQPVVDTNLSAMFFINSNGYFVVHNGPASPDPTNSTKWVTLTNHTPIATGSWTRVDILLDYPTTNWTLYVAGSQITNNIGFIDTSITNLSRFDTYNGNATSYIDNIYMTVSKTLIIDGLVASNKYYDGNATASLTTNNLSLVGIDAGDTVTLEGTNGAITGVFVNKSVDESKTVTITGYTLGGADADGYTLITNTTATIFAKPLTLSGLAVSNKVYDGNVVATISSTGTLTGIVGAEVCYVPTNSMAANFVTKTTGSGKDVIVSGITLSGTDGTNYSIANHTVTADITTNALSITTLLVSDKVYDGSSNATVATSTFATVVSGDSCILDTGSAVAYFNNKDVGSGKAVAVTNITLTGSDSSNYSVTNQSATTATASIMTNSSALSLGSLTASNKVYDGTSNALITSYGSLSGVFGADVVTLDSNSASAFFSDKNVAGGKTVTVSGLLLSGADGPNYSISNQTTTANITQLPLTITADDKSKEYQTADPLLTVSYATFVGGDDSNVISGLAISRTPGETVGPYAITPSGATAANYSMAFVTGTLTITKTTRTVTFNPTSPQTYNTMNGLSATVSVGVGTWTFTVMAGPGAIVSATNLWMGAGYGTVTVRASVTGDATNFAAYADGYVVAQVAPETNSIPWYDYFETYGTNAPLVNGINGWYASSTNCVVQQNVKRSGTQAVMLPVDVTLSNRFDNTFNRLVKMELYSQVELYNGTNYPTLTNNVAIQFFVNSNGYFVVGNGSNWKVLTNMASGAASIPIANTYFTRIRLNLRYKNHTWKLKAWTNDTDLVANTRYMNFTSNLNIFSGFDVYNGNTTSYVDDVSVTNVDFNLLPKVNDVPVDIIRSINDAPPVVIDGIRIDGRNE